MNFLTFEGVFFVSEYFFLASDVPFAEANLEIIVWCSRNGGMWERNIGVGVLG